MHDSRRVRWMAVALVALARVGLAHAEPPRLARVAWTTDQGLPVNAVNDIQVAHDGYVWLATFDGLVRFDGVRFTVFDAESTPGLDSNRIVSVDEAPDGALWLRTEPGTVLRRDPVTGGLRSWDFSAGRDQPPALAIGRDGTVWVLVPGGVARFDGEEFTPILLGEGVDTTSLAVGPDGAVWVGTVDRGLARLEGPQVRWFVTSSGAPTSIRDVAVGPDGSVWATTWLSVLRVRDGVLVPLPGAPPASEFVDSRPVATDEAWINTEIGSYHWRAGVATPLDPGTPGRAPIRTAAATDPAGHDWRLSRTGVFRDGELVARAADGHPWTDLETTPEGGVWIGSGGGGLMRLRDAPITTLGPEVLPGLDEIYPLAASVGGGVWAGSQRGGLFRLGPDGAEAVPESEGLPRNVRALLEDPDGTLWAGLHRRGLFRRTNGHFMPVDGVPTGSVRLLERRRDGALLASIGDALWELRDGAWARLVTDPPLPDAPVRTALETDDGLWLGTNGAGLLRLVGRQLTRFGRAEGFPSDVIRALWRSDAGVLWIGTEDRGLLGWAPGEPAPRALSQREGLPDHCVHALVPDLLGGVWGSTNRGLFRASEADLDAYARGERAQVYVVPFGRSDGMADVEANGGVHRTGLRTADGRIWFSSQRGVVVVRPDQVRVEDATARPVVEALRLGGEARMVGSGRRIDPEERSFGIDYTALPATVGPKQRFWYKLEGVDPTWVDAGGRRTAWYTQVPPGKHTFHVRTTGPADEAGAEATLELDVVPRFHETTWFRALVAVGVAGSLALVVRSRLAAARRREAALEARVRARTADLAAEKELAQAAERTIAAQAARLAEADRVKTRFFQDLSHELRTPLTLVIGPLEDVGTGRHGPVTPAVEAQVGLAERNARRLFALVNQLLDLVRLDAGALRLERVPQDLVPLVAAVCEVHQPLADRRGITLSLAAPADPVVVDFDRRELEKVFANLLGNALKFTPVGGRVGVTVTPDSERVEVAITDTGPGLSAAVRERLFERFHSPGESSVQLGSGIGLSLARDLTERHDGQIRVESEAGKGSTFIVSLPRSRAAHPSLNDPMVATAPTPALEEVAGAEAAAEDRTTVLVVDDHPEVRAWIRGHLAPRYRVIEAANGREALAVARRALPDLVVSDVMMPEVDGYDLVRALRADRDLDAVPVVLLTAKGSDASRIEGLQRGADAWLTKPFSSAVLVAQVDGLIAQRRLLRERLAPPPPGAAPPPPAADGLLSVDEAYIRKVRAAIDAHLHEPSFGVQELADAVAQDRAHLFRRVKELTGEAPSTLLRVARLERAAALLARRVASVGEIAYAVGFNGMSHFSKAFRDHYGVPPSAWSNASGRPADGKSGTLGM